MRRLEPRYLYVAAASAAITAAAIAIPAWADSGGSGSAQPNVRSAPFPGPPPPGGAMVVAGFPQGAPGGPDARRARRKVDQFTRCMRAHGAGVPGLQVHGAGFSLTVPPPQARDVMKQIAKDCGLPPPPPGTQLLPLSKKQMEQNRKAMDNLAQCMRSKGKGLRKPR